jgi:hypothetical protein
MRYAYQDLGKQPRGAVALVRWRGSPAEIFLLDSVNFCKYRDGASFSYSAGGNYRHSPAEVHIPDDGHWFVVVDFHRHSGELAATIEVIVPDHDSSRREPVAAAH